MTGYDCCSVWYGLTFFLKFFLGGLVFIKLYSGGQCRVGGLCIGMYAKRVVRGVFDTFNVPLLYPFQCFFLVVIIRFVSLP